MKRTKFAILLVCFSMLLILFCACSDEAPTTDTHADSGSGTPALEGELSYLLNEEGDTYSVIGIGTYRGKDLVLGNGITEIPEAAFYHCSEVTSLAISDGERQSGVRHSGTHIVSPS